MKLLIIKILKYAGWTVLGLLGLIILSIVGVNIFTEPRLDRDWTLDQKIPPTVTRDTSSEWVVTIWNVRNFTYRSTEDYTPSYYTGSYRLADLESAYYIIEPFSENTGPAHTMISFGFSGGQYVTISAEIRKEIGESFSPLKALFASYELIYIIGDERDLIGLRANHRKDRVFVYPVRASKKKLQNLFVSMVDRADTLGRNPEWYNLIWKTCTTSILDHINELRESRVSLVEEPKPPIRWSYKIFLPYYSDEVALENDFLDTSLPLEEARAYYQINDLAARYADDPDFSTKIRKPRK